VEHKFPLLLWHKGHYFGMIFQGNSEYIKKTQTSLLIEDEL
jgi:hypothetical protein